MKKRRDGVRMKNENERVQFLTKWRKSLGECVDVKGRAIGEVKDSVREAKRE